MTTQMQGFLGQPGRTYLFRFYNQLAKLSKQSSMRTCLLIALVLRLSLDGHSLAQPTPSGPDQQRFAKLTYVTGGDTLRYRLLYPLACDARKKYPLLLYLHGNGERGNDNQTPLLRVPAGLTSAIGLRRYPCFILVPQCPKKQVWVDFPHFPKSLRTSAEPTLAARLTLSLIDRLIHQLAIDTDRVYITGYSSGGGRCF